MQKKQDIDIWDNFSVSHKQLDPMEYYNSYLLFKNIVDKLPKRDLINYGWLTSNDDLSSLVPLFHNIVDDKFKTLFRKNSTANEAFYALWLSQVSEMAREKVIKQEVAPFVQLTKQDLKDIAKLSLDESLIIDLPRQLAAYGIILIYQQGIPGMKLDGAVFKLITGHPVIGISFRYPRIDNFWFTLMHELAHIVLHFEKLDDPIFDDLEQDASELIERQANRLAKNSFVDRSIWRNCTPMYQIGNKAVYDFSKEVGIHPAIIAGLLRYEKKSFNIYNKIINAIDLRKKVFGNE